jgi:type II secretory pathway predicted ATPase ExeA
MMKASYRTFFALTREPFPQDLAIEEILTTEDVLKVADRCDYAVRLGAMAVVTGEVGSGKSTALRWAASRFHPSEYRQLFLTATSGSILEIYRLLAEQLEVETASSSRAVLTRIIRHQVLEITQAQKQKLILFIDEASLMRLDVYGELHTITQFEGDSKPLLPIILAGQNNLVDLLRYRNSAPLASRVVTRAHLMPLSREGMETYLVHHLKIAGITNRLFSEEAVTAIYQGAGGSLRRANHLARGALIAAAMEKMQIVGAEHVRLASTELI